MAQIMLRIEELIKLLLDQEALLFGDFTLKSGRKSPFYFNMAKAVKSGEGFSKISATLAGYIYANFIDSAVPENRRVDPETIFIFGPAYKGIPLAAGVAFSLNDKHKVNVRWGFNRKEVKMHGDKDDRYLMGEIRDGDNVIIIDDVLTTGNTKLEARDHLIEATGLKNLNFVGMVALVDRFEGALELRQNIDCYGVIRIDSLVELCYKKRWITEENYKNFHEYFDEHGLVQK
ncbi:MAG: orotate phosphoribosyltransferase [Candidatus Hodarchaeota archaeon]